MPSDLCAIVTPVPTIGIPFFINVPLAVETDGSA